MEWGDEAVEGARMVGIVAEYNPFHNGHAWQVRAVRERCPRAALVAVMSGSFTQRGEAAILDKWTRAALAVRGGCDLVLELPFVFSCRSAQSFARGAVRLLGALGAGGAMAFGAECDSLGALSHAAEAIDSAAVQREVGACIRAGSSYAVALGAVLAAHTGLAEGVLRGPNNILAIEYLRALSAYSVPLVPILVPRHGAVHDAPALGVVASASAIRRAVRRGDLAGVQAALPAASFEAVRAAFPSRIADDERLFPALLALLVRARGASLRAYLGMGEGLEQRLLQKARGADSLAALVASMVTSRYPASRIRRLLPHLLLGAEACAVAWMDDTGPLYARVLAFNDTGRALLRACKGRSTVPIITKTSAFLTSKARREGERSALQEMLALDTMATELRALCVADRRARDAESDFLQSPRFLR